MKKIFFLLCLWLINIPAYAQYSDGRIARDFLTQDMNGNMQALYDTLNLGKAYLIFSFHGDSTDDWNYYQSGVLQSFYEAHGPNGDNTTSVLGFGASSWDGLWGQNPTTQGNWMQYATFPMWNPEWTFEVPPNEILISDIAGIVGPYGPTSMRYNVFLICPDRKKFRIGHPNEGELWTSVQGCGIATQPNDAKVAYADMDTLATCLGQPRGTVVYLSNMGTQPLTQCDIQVQANGQVVSNYHWTGNLPTYHLDTVAIPDWVADGTTTQVSIFTKSPNASSDAVPANDTFSRTLGKADYWDSDTIEVEVQADGYGHQIYWEILDANGVAVDSGGNVDVDFYNGNAATTDVTAYNDYQYDSRTIPLSGEAVECMTIRVLSGMGYGTCCTWGNGYIRFKKHGEIIYEYTDFGRRALQRLTTTLVGTEDASSISRLKAYPNPTEGDMTLSFHLETSALVALQVYNSVGQQVYHGQQSYTSGTQQYTLQTSNWPVGLYFATLRDAAGGVQSVRFVVAR